MSTEQKAKAYDEVRERIALRFGSNVAEEIFSEFEMSEDERIRKEFCKDIWTFIPNEKAHKYIAWLEKQEVKSSPYNDVSISHDNGILVILMLSIL